MVNPAAIGAAAVPIPPITLVLGGARSGKSAFAEDAVERHAERCGGARLYLATAEARDSEMAARIAAHRARRGTRWATIEEPIELVPIELVPALAGAARPDGAVLVDCLTLWLANLMDRGRDLGDARGGLVDSLAGLGGPVVFVANEVGLGIVPDNPAARAFRDHAGWLNQSIAERADRVVFIAAGLPLAMKG